MILASGMNTLFEIVISNEAPLAVRFAAEELQDHVGQMVLGGPPCIKTDEEQIGAKEVLVGDSAHRRKLFPDIRPAGLALEGYFLVTRGPHLLVLGGSPRGTLYGVYDLLERLGVRWWTATEAHVPKKTLIAISGLNVHFTPPLIYRAIWYRNAMDGDWLARMRLNGGAAGGPHLKERHGGMERYAADAGCHTYMALVPPERYHKRHPEYFSEVNGVRLRHVAQLCCTNPQVADIAAETARQWLKRTPEARLVSITHNDWNNWCTCPKCAALIAKEGAPSAITLHLANEVAKRLEREFPDVLIDTFAYGWTQTPPRHMQAHPNVLVRICPIGNCFGHPIRTCKRNAECREAVTKWSRISQTIFVWHYVNDFFHYMSPWPCLPSLEDDIHYYLEHRLKGLFLQANGNSNGGDFADLKAYIWAKKIWNPALKLDDLRQEFMAGYYGDAADAVEEYCATFEKAFKAAGPDYHLLIYNQSPWKNTSPYLALPVLNRARKTLVRAYAQADSAVVASRLDKLQAGLDYTELFYFQRPLPTIARGNTLVCRAGKRRETLARRFFATCKRENFSHYREHLTHYATITSLRRAWLDSLGQHPLLTLSSVGARMKVTPSLGGRIVEYTPAGKNLDLLGKSCPQTFGYPCTGGYEEYTEHHHQAPGFSEQFHVVKKTGNSLVLRARLDTSLVLERSIRLESGTGNALIRTTLKNLQDAAIPGTLRAHLEIDLHTAIKEVEAWFLIGTKWQKREPPLSGAFYEEDVPDGWAFWSPARAIGLWQTWSRQQVGAAFLCPLPLEPTVLVLDLLKDRYDQPIPPDGMQKIAHRFGWLNRPPVETMR